MKTEHVGELPQLTSYRAGGWCGLKVCGVRIIFRVVCRRPEARVPDVRHSDLVGIVGEGALQLRWYVMEADPVVERLKAGAHVVGDGLVDETVHDFPHPLVWLDG